MKAVIQLVSRAAVTVEQQEKREIGQGYVILPRCGGRRYGRDHEENGEKDHRSAPVPG